MPRITCCTRSTSASISVRTPATLRPSTRTSFGHLMRGVHPAVSASAAATATPATSATCGTAAGGSAGRSTIEQ